MTVPGVAVRQYRATEVAEIATEFPHRSETGIGAFAPADARYVTLATNATLTQERVLTGTANQIVITDGGAGGNVTLSTPQNIHTGATPTFAGLTLSGASANKVVYTDGSKALTTTANFHFDGSVLILGAAVAAGGALLTLTSTTQGLRIPVMTTAQRDLIAGPAEGLILYNSTTQQVNYRDASSWLGLASGISGSGTLNYVTVWSSGTAVTGFLGLQFTNAAGLVVNENGDAAIDVRFEGDTASNLFWVDASTETIQFGTTVAGQIAFFRSTNVVFGENGGGIDFRIEGVDFGGGVQTNLFYVDSGSNGVTIGTSVAGDIAKFYGGGSPLIVFNEDAGDRDIRFESTGNAFMFLLDAGANRIGLGTGSTTVGSAVTVAGGLVETDSDTSTTPRFIINQGSTGDAAMRWALSSTISYAAGIDNSDSDKWKVSYAGSGTAILGTNDYLTVDTAGQIALPVQGSSGGLLIGTDVQWYRSAADVWRTPDSVQVDGTVGINSTPSSSNNLVITSTFTAANAAGLYISKDVTNPTSTSLSARIDLIDRITSTGTHHSTAVQGQLIPVISSGITESGVWSGLRYAVYRISASDAGTQNGSINGIYVEAGHVSGVGNVTSAETHGVRVEMYATGTASSAMTTVYGVSVNVNGSTTPITTAYSLYLEPMTATTAYVIYTTGGTLRFGGTSASLVGFRGATPVAAKTYTVTNGATDRTYDANATSVAELADILFTLLQDLDDMGIVVRA